MGITKDIIEAEFRTKGGSQVQKDMSEVQKNIALINRENERLIITKAKLEANNKKGSKEWDNVTRKLKENNVQLGRNKAQLKVLESQMKVTDMSSKQLKDHFHKLSREITKTNQAIHPERWNRLNKELKETEQQMGRVNGKTQKARSAMSKTKGIASTFLPIASVTGFIAILKSATTELFSLTKTMQGDAVRSTTVFGDQLGYVASEAEKVADRMGLTNREFVANAAATADLLIPLDFTRDAAAKMSVELQGLTGALDEWTGGSVGAAEVSNILTKAMLGENEQLKQLGIAIRKDSQEFRDLVKVKLAAGDVTKAQAEAMATLELITKKSADAQAAYNQEGNKLLRIQKKVTVWWKKKKEAMVDYFQASKSEQIEKQQQQVNLLTTALYNNNLENEERKKLYDELKVLAPDIVATLDAEMKATDATRLALEKYNDAMINKIILAKKDEELNGAREKAADARMKRRQVELDVIKEIIESGSFAKAYYESAGKYDEYETIRDSSDDTMTKLQNLKDLNTGLSFEFDKRRETLSDAIDDEKQALDELTQLENKKKDFLKGLSTGIDDGTSTGTPTPKKLPTGKAPKQIKIKSINLPDNWEDQVSEEMDKLNDKLIEEYLNGRDRLKQIQEEYGLADSETVNQQALASIKKLLDERVISEQEYQNAKAAIEENSLQQSIERQLKYRMLQEDSRLLDMETEEFNYEERLMLEEERYQAALDIENDRYALEVDRARDQKELLLELENDHKKELIRVEETYGQRKADVVAKQNAIEKGRLQIAAAVADGIVSIMGQESEIGKAALIIKQGLAMAGATIDLAKGMSATASVGFPQNVPLITAFIGQTAGFIGTIMNATKSVKSGNTNFSIRGKKDGGFTGWSANDDDPMGFYHANEFVGNANAVRNPSIKPVFDIIDVAQKNGTISTIDLPRAIAGQLPGRTTSAQVVENSNGPVTVIPPELITIIERNTEVMDRLEQNGVQAVWEWQREKEGREKMTTLEKDVGM